MSPWNRGTGLALLLCIAAFSRAGATLPLEVTLADIGMAAIPTESMIEATVIGDLSGIAYDRTADRFLALSDSSGSGNARIYAFNFTYNAEGVAGITTLWAESLQNEFGGWLPSVDAEGLALSQNGHLYVSTEGRYTTSPPDSRDPGVWAFDGETLNRTAALPVPEKFMPRDAGGNAVPPGHPDQATGVRLNLGFECLGLSPAERSLFAANEAALLQDDARGPFDGEFNQAHNSDSRIIRYQRDVQGAWHPGPERVYRADRGTLFIFVRRFNTIPSILPVSDDGRLLVMERGLTQNNLNTGSYRIRIYEVDFNDESALDVSPYDSLLDLPSPIVLTRLSKRLVWQSSSGMDNVEGMTWGRDLNGFRSLALVSDNNSSSAQITQFHALLSNIPAPVPLSVAVEGPGSVYTDPPLADHLPGSSIELAAEADPEKVFLRWSGDASGSGETQTLTAAAGVPLHVTARFGTPFHRWLFDAFTEEEIETWNLYDPTVSSAGDGVSNFMRYAMGFGPWDPVEGFLPYIARVSGQLQYLYYLSGNRPDVTWRVLGVNDLRSGWEDASVLFESMHAIEAVPDDGWFALPLPSSLTGGTPPDRSQFLRLVLMPVE